MKLPVLESRRAETTLCTYCPKLCRPACPVSTVEGRETVTPWGKMRAMGELLREAAPLDAAHAAPAYACTGCMRCFELCELDNPVADTLRDGRVEALRAAVAPDAARELVTGFARREARLEQVARRWPESANARAAYVPGCTAVVFRADSVATVANAIGRIHARCDVVADRCCGLPLLEAGDREGFVRRARSFAERVGGFERVITGDAGCAHAMRVFYPAHGVVLPRVEHIAETAAGALRNVPVLRDPPKRVAYHDSCRLGRGLGVFDQPRAVLERLLGERAIELPESREMAPCSGAGGLLPLTRPATARGIAHELAGLAREVGAETVVTGCASSRRALAAAGVPTEDLAELLGRALTQ